MTLKELQDLIMKQAEEKGWGTKPEDINVGEKLALIHSEVSEALEAYRKKNLTGEHDSFDIELGDVITRVIHLAGIMDVDIEKVIMEKLEANKDRKWEWDKMNETRK